MGAIRDFFFPQIEAAQPVSNVDVAAALTPIQTGQAVYNFLAGSTATTRNIAMSVPAVARARNIICGTIGSLPLEQYNRLTGAHIEPQRVINQQIGRAHI